MTEATTARTPGAPSWLRQAREAAGISAEEATFRLRGVLPRSLWVSSDTVRRLEAKENPDPLVAAALLRCYGHSLDDVPESFAADLAAIRGIVDANVGTIGLTAERAKPQARRHLRAVPAPRPAKVA